MLFVPKSNFQFNSIFIFYGEKIFQFERKVGANTILQGESGCGKSELVRVFSEIINLNFDVVPDKEGILHKIIVSLGCRFPNSQQKR
jgi:ABC-type phosphate transport system ATPase subunit